MNYKEARDYLHHTAKYGSVLGLETIRVLLEKLGNPHNDLKFIHIAGTNGKGSVLAYLSTILKEAGYVVGRYISPTLFSYRERIQVNEEYIEKTAFAKWTTKIAAAIEKMQSEGMSHPTSFEIETAMSFLYFKEKCCDIVVLETGLGGLEDATNIIATPIMAIITSISMDHMDILGNTLSEIACQKGGIIKPHTTVVAIKQNREVMDVLESICRNRCSLLYEADWQKAEDVEYGYERQSFSYREYRNLHITLAGKHQIMNAILAVESVHQLNQLGYVISEESLRKGLEITKWKGRFTILQKEPLFIIDGAHNIEAAKMLRESLELYFKDRKIFYILGMLKDKEYEKVIKQTVCLAEHVIAVETPNHPRALLAKRLADTITKFHKSVETADSIYEAVEKSFTIAEKEDVIVAFGSLSYLGEITKAVDIMRSAKIW